MRASLGPAFTVASMVLSAAAFHCYLRAMPLFVKWHMRRGRGLARAAVALSLTGLATSFLALLFGAGNIAFFPLFCCSGVAWVAYDAMQLPGDDEEGKDEKQGE